MKIYIIGCSCSGKTTLARGLSEYLGIKHLELDEYWWLPDWKMRDKQEFRQMIREETARHDCWVIDGNYSLVSDLLLPEADLVIWLNLPFLTVFWRSIRRTIKRIHSQEAVCNGNTENLGSLLGWYGMPMWIIRSYGRRRKFGLSLLAKDQRVIELKNSTEISEIYQREIFSKQRL